MTPMEMNLRRLNASGNTSSPSPISSSSLLPPSDNASIIEMIEKDPEVGQAYSNRAINLKQQSNSSLGSLAIATATSSSNFFMYSTSALVILWYASAVFAISSSKMILIETKAPLLLCLVQFCSSAILTYILSTNLIPSFGPSLSKSLPLSSSSSTALASSVSPSFSSFSSSSYTLRSNIMPQESSATRFIFMTSISYTLGFVFTNLSFNLVNANFAETIKSAEPLSSVLIGHFLLNESTSLASYLTLIPICAGVAIACLNDVSFDPYGFIFAAISNICFSCRAVFTKRVKQLDKSMDENSLFYHISVTGLYLIIPLFIIFEMRHTVNYFLELMNNKGAVGLVHMIFMFIVNGATYTCYNLVSYYVLTRVDLITHAVLNVFRRVVIIASTAFLFDIQLSNLNKLGVAVALLGVIFFTIFKRLNF